MKKSKIYPCNEFYTLIQIVDQGLTTLTFREAHRRFHKLLNDKMFNIGYTVYQDGNIWKIHKNLLPYFQYQIKIRTLTISYDFDPLP